MLGQLHGTLESFSHPGPTPLDKRPAAGPSDIRGARQSDSSPPDRIGVAEEEFDDHGGQTIYLVGECEYPEDQQEILRESAAIIFYEEVSAWHLDDEQYPEFNDFGLFEAWFDTECFGMVTDAIDGPLTKSG